MRTVFLALLLICSLEARRVPLSPKEEQKLQLEASKLRQEGFAVIAPFLTGEEELIYLQDEAFIEAFPFQDYPLIQAEGQGLFFVNNINDTIKNILRKGQAWEVQNMNLIKKHIKPGTYALDIGSHIGTHTVTMSHAVGKKGRVVAFEPSKTTYRELCYNLAANKLSNVSAVRVAVEKEKSLIDVITSHPNNEGGNYVIDSKGGENSALQLTLDDFNLNNISFMKIDVENMEADVLDGAYETILRNRPIILIEIQGNGERPVQLGEDTESMALISRQKLIDLNYQLEHVQGADWLATPL